jgi:hypothetical protein
MPQDHRRGGGPQPISSFASTPNGSTARYGRRLLRWGIAIRPMSGWGHERPKGDVRAESVRLPTGDIGWRVR